MPKKAAPTNENKSDESNKNVFEFEVEKIIDHKEMMHFLVRWKHFSSKDDTWERDSRYVSQI